VSVPRPSVRTSWAGRRFACHAAARRRETPAPVGPQSGVAVWR